MRTRSYLCSATIGALLATTPSWAQVQQAKDSERGPDEATLEEIVVTAQKREESLQKVPIAVTAITADKIAQSQINDIQELNLLTPSLNVVSTLGFVKPFIRGLGGNSNNPGLEAPISVYVDGVYLSSTPSAFFAFNDIARIEVLKGPQGTLFGRNATGGLIQVITKDPTENVEFKGEASYGNYQTSSANVYVAGGLAEGLAASLSTYYLEQGEGYGRNAFDGKDANLTEHDMSVRGKLVWTPGSRTTLKLSGDYSDRDAPLFAWRSSLGYRPGFPTLLAPNPSNSAWDVNNNAPNPSNYTGGGGSFRIEHGFDWADFLSLTAYRRSNFNYGGDIDTSPIPALALNVSSHEKQFSQELQLLSKGDGALSWVVGAYYLDRSARSAPAQVTIGGPFAPNPTSAVMTQLYATVGGESYAAFAQGTYEISTGTKVTVGLRETHESQFSERIREVITLKNGFQIINPYVKNTATFDKLTWRLALDHEFTDDILGYVSYNRGFKSGAYNVSFPLDPALRPEAIDAYEVGLKTESFDQRLRLNGAVFLYDYTNIQTSFARGGLLALQNGAKATDYGVEWDLDTIISDHLSLNAGAQWLHTKFDSFPQGNLATPNPAGGFIQVNGDLTGNQLPQAPKFTLSVGGDLHYTTGIGEVAFAVNYLYNDGFFPEADNTLRQSHYHMVSSSLRWESRDQRLYGSIWGKNLVNEAVFSQGFAGGISGQETYQSPRTYGVTVGVNF